MGWGGNGDFFPRGINFNSKHLGGAIKIQLTTPVKKSITYHNALCHPKIFRSFSRGHFNFQEKPKTILMQNFGVTKKRALWYVRVFSGVVNWYSV